MAKPKTEEESLRKGNPMRRNSNVAIDFETLVCRRYRRCDHKAAQKSRETPGPTQRDKQDPTITS